MPSSDIDPTLALEKVLRKVEDQRARLARIAPDSPYWPLEEKLLKILLQSASLAKTACLLLDNDKVEEAWIESHSITFNPAETPLSG